MVYVRHARPYCPRGHHLTDENSYIASGGSRVCGICAQHEALAEAARTQREPAPSRGAAREKFPATTARFACTKCWRTIAVPDAHRHSDTTVAAMVTADGWALIPHVLCALHAAAAEAYSKPDYRRARATGAR